MRSIALAYRHPLGGIPLALAAERVHNPHAASDLDSGWACGASLGSLRKPWDWQAYDQFVNLEQDALLALVAQDDFQRRTNLRGHLAGMRLRLVQKAQVHAFVLTSRPEGGPRSPGLRLAGAGRPEPDLLTRVVERAAHQRITPHRGRM